MFVPKMRDGFASERHIKKPLVAVNELSPSVNSKNVAVNSENVAVKKVSKEDRKTQIVKLLTREKQLSSSEISNAIGIKITLTKKYLAELVAENRIQTTGTFRNRSYHIINKD